MHEIRMRRLRVERRGFLRVMSGGWIRGLRLALVLVSWMTSGLAQADGLPLPVADSSVSFSVGAPSRVFRVDLSTLPNRPALVVEAMPVVADPTIQMEVELTNFVPEGIGPSAFCHSPSQPSFSSGTQNGGLDYERELWRCEPRVDRWAGYAVDVIVRVLDFGTSGSPLDVAIEIRGETRVPTNTLASAVETSLAPATVFIPPEKDTVLYEGDASTSNGGGQSLWVGQNASITSLIPFTVELDQVRSLISFPVVDEVPFNAVVQNANIEIQAFDFLGGGGEVTLFKMAKTLEGASWTEGTAVAPGSQFEVGATGGSGANWLERRPGVNWSMPGGDPVNNFASPLAIVDITTNGFHDFTGPGLVSAVQEMVDQRSSDDGFLLTGPGNITDLVPRGVRIASRELDPTVYPLLRVDYVPAQPFSEGDVVTDVVTFLSEGEDFRWLYDLDNDNIFVTDIGGSCEADPDPIPRVVPYTYAWTGTPGYTGLDCCTWEVSSTLTSTVGVGQALFFHNLDPADPANLPEDFDSDGIFDLCDNCPYVPNGPSRGSCLNSTTGDFEGTCNSDLDCVGGALCSLSQEDGNTNRVGNACEVPEPGFGLGVGLSVWALAIRRRRATRKSERFVAEASA